MIQTKNSKNWFSKLNNFKDELQNLNAEVWQQAEVLTRS